MPRRSPPTALRLHEGPLPSRGKPKFTLPSVPRPIFHAPSIAPRGPAPRARQASVSSNSSNSSINSFDPSTLSQVRASSDYFPTTISPSSSQASSPSASIGSNHGHRQKMVRGPWDSANSIVVPFDVGSVLPPPKRAAVSPGGGLGGR